ncbi:hypothetical protein SK128_012685 [Halocaridina rubra]|uniref:Ig-like domain-containing protein n=1 Tax=Halocaridina rubra TaxID=373956 RepID=A0AAN8WT52_HALRR
MLIAWNPNQLMTITTLWITVTQSYAKITKIQDSSGDSVEREDPVWNIRHVLPALDLENNTVTDVKVNVGDVAYLPCRFPKLSTLHQVSWIRRWDWHILTTGIYTYTSDQRFNILHTEGSDDWTLQLKYVHTRDNGTYECQMYTGTGVLSLYVNLHVNKPRAVILGRKDLHFREGDTITLVCVIQQSKPSFVFWYQGENMVNYEGDRDRIKVTTDVEGARTVSRLTVQNARKSDSGNYSCIPPHVESAFVVVYVSEGDIAAAIRRGYSSASSVNLYCLSLPFLSASAFTSAIMSYLFSVR